MIMKTTLITPKTANAKLGENVATTYRPVGAAAKGHGTCPNCPLLPENGGACYTKSFLVNRQQKASLIRNDDLERLKAKGAKFVRLHTSGDFFMQDETAPDGFALDTEYLDAIIQWSKDNSDIVVWTYTHDVRKMIAAGYSYTAGSFPSNLHITASIENQEDRSYAKEFGFRTARVIKEKDDKVKGETLCPYDLSLNKKEKPTTTCAKCTLCFNPKHEHDIAFLLH